MLPRLALLLASAFATTACVQSTGGRVQALNQTVRTVSISPTVAVPRSAVRSDVGQTLLKGNLRIEDVVRREFHVALQRGKYFQQIVGAVPITPTDSDWDMEPTRERRGTTPADAYFHLRVLSFGYYRTTGFVSSEARINIEAKLVDRAGNVLAWGQGNSWGSTVPTRYPREFLGDARMTANDLGVAARVASERILAAIHRPGAERGRRTTTVTTTKKTTTTTTSKKTPAPAPTSSGARPAQS